ncbi:MAG: methyltransferase [Bacteroidetes bacterium 4572_117]|nr:MAG: methyltransferase [Bacteroidetes bacterium 4572_117]
MELSPEIDEYIIKNLVPENALLAEINRETHAKVLMPRMLSGQLQGRILSMISNMLKPKLILEIGTYTGYSALCLAEGLSADGKLHTIEINDELETFVLKYFEQSEYKNHLHLHIGDALEIIQKLPNNIDLVFIDADKRIYLDYYHLIIDKLRPGGIILADNVLWGNKVVTPLAGNDEYTKGILAFNDFVKTDNRVENVILPVRDGIMMLRKL